MGRTSKRIHGNNGKITGNSGGRDCVYKAGIYARLSSGQGREKDVSIETQIEIAEAFVQSWNDSQPDKIEIVERYVDLGKTGTNFNRNAFDSLMQAVRLGDINCIIVKDLSRFGRNYLEAGNYIEKIFPFLGVRFVAVSDEYDTVRKESGNRQVAVEIKNLVNDMYAKDSSKKAKIHLKQRREEGSYVGGPPPYGYRTAWEGRLRKLIPDENTAEIVRYIFEEFVRKQNYQAVTDDLNRKRVNPPAVYRKTGEVYCPEGVTYKGWERTSVSLILQSENYIGRLVQGKTSISGRNEENRVENPASDWVVKDCAHEPLIEQELFWQAAAIQNMLRQKAKSRKTPSKSFPLEENIFDKVLYCGVCGHKMTRTSYVHSYADGRSVKYINYMCPNSKSTKTESCSDSNHILKGKLEDILTVLFQKECSAFMGRKKAYMEKGKENLCQARAELEKEQKIIDHTIRELKQEESTKYMAYRMGQLPQNEYVSFKLQKEKSLQELAEKSDSLIKEEKDLERKGENYLKAIRSLVKWNDKKKLTKELVETLTDRIYVYPGKRVEVVFSYIDPFSREVCLK